MIEALLAALGFVAIECTGFEDHFPASTTCYQSGIELSLETIEQAIADNVEVVKQEYTYVQQDGKNVGEPFGLYVITEDYGVWFVGTNAFVVPVEDIPNQGLD